ncbi:MAG: hypothetical protein JWR37_3469 [Mycobacterium sp.]|nr:hypothetical protein [Mycobacterium sp.]
MSGQKGIVQRIERRLEVTVGDAFARVFGGSIVPQEVEAMLRREAADGVRSVGGGHILAPNDYIITLSMRDYEKVSADPDITSATFAKHLGGYIRDQGWQTYGDVVVRFERSPTLHTGQFRAEGAVNPDSTTGEPAPPQPDRVSNAEPGVPPMTDNPSNRGGQGQGRPADEYYDDRYGRPQDEQRPGDPRPPYPPEPGAYPPPGEPPAYPPRPGYPPAGEGGGYPDQGGYPDPGYPPPSYEQRPPAGYGGPPGGYDPNYRQGPGGYGGPAGGQPGYGNDYGDYGRPGAPPAPGRHEEPGYGRPDARPAYPDQGGYPDQGYPGGQGGYGRQEYGQPDYGRYGEPPAGGGYADPGYADPAGREYDYGQPGGQGGYGAGGYAPGDYPAGGSTITLQLDDGSGRTYQLREGANVIGRGQDAQFRLPDTGVSRRHLEIRWDGQVALLSDLNSTNGTTVNNAPVQEWQLADGDVIRLGHSEIVVRVH